MANTVEELDFRLIIDDSEFNQQIAKDIKAAETLNAEISQLLDIKAKARDLKLTVDTTEAVGGLKELNDYYRQLEAAEWDKVGEGLDFSSYVQETLNQLRLLEEEIEVIQELRRENPEGEGLAEAYRNANAQAQNLLATIQALREAEKGLGGGDTQFRDYIRSLTEPSIEYLQLVEQMKEEERVSRELEKAKEEEAKAREKAANARQKERNAASKSMDGEFKEYIASLTQVNDELEEMGRYYRELEREGENTDKNTEKMRKQSRVLGQLKSLAAGYISVLGAKNLVSNIVRVTAEFELQKTTLAAILQDAEKANELYEQMKRLAVKSPFNFKELTTFTKQLSAYSIPTKDLYETTKMLADVSAGLGVGMDRLVLAYGQIRSASFLRGQEVRQLTEAGIPILEELRKQFVELGEEGLTVGEVFDKISQRMVPFEMVEKVFKDMTSEGGKFYQMQEVQAETLRGKLSNLKDAYQIMFSEIGEKQSGLLKGTVDFLRMITEHYESIGRVILELVTGFGVYTATVIVTEKVTKSFTVENYKLLASLDSLWKKLKLVVANNPMAAIAALVAALSFELLQYAKRADTAAQGVDNFNRYLDDQNKKLEENNEKVNTLLKNAKDVDTSYADRVTAMRHLIEIYPELLQYYKDEYDALDNIRSINEQISAINLTRRFEADSARLSELQQKLQNVNDAIKASEGNAGSQAIPAMRNQAKELEKEIELLKTEMSTYDAPFFNGPQYIPASQQLSGWRKGIADIIREAEGKKFSLGLSFNPKNIDTSSLDDVIKEVQGRIEEVQKSRANAVGIENEAVIAGYDAQLEYLERINKALGNKATVQKNTSKQTAEQFAEERKSIEARIGLIKKMKEAHDDLAELNMSEDTINETLLNFFGASRAEVIGIDYEKEISKLIVLLKTLGNEGEQAAQKMLDSIADEKLRNRIKELSDNAKDRAEFESRVQEYIRETMSIEQRIDELEQKRAEDLAQANLTTEQAAAINAHYDEEIDKLKQSLLELTSIQLTEFWQNLTGEKNGTYANLTKLQRQAEKLRDAISGITPNRNKDGKITGYTLTQKDNGDILKALGIDADKVQLSVAQVEALNNAIDKLISKRADKNGILALFDAIKEGGFKSFWKEITEGSDNAVAILSGASSQLSELGDIFIELGEATGSDFLSSMGDTLSFIGKFADRLASGDVIGAVKTIVSSLTSWITSAQRLKTAISETLNEAKKLNAELKLSQNVESIFGTNELKKLDNAVELLKEYRSLVVKERSRASSDITWKSGIFNWGRSKKSLKDAVSELGYDLYDAYGNLNARALQAILDTYENLTSADRAWIEEAIRNSEIYAEAMEQMDDVLESVYGDTLDSVTDALIESWKQAGDAALDYTDILDEVATSYARMLVKNAIAEKVFNDEFKEKLKKATDDKDAVAAVELFKSALDEVSNYTDYVNDVMSRLEPYFKDSEGSDSLSNGIKGITEDTANLLASYLNAIRADVSFNKTQIATISADIKQLLGIFPASPTLNDYLNQIQANTFDTAQSNREILSEIRSVMGLGGEGTALRVITT